MTALVQKCRHVVAARRIAQLIEQQLARDADHAPRHSPRVASLKLHLAAGFLPLCEFRKTSSNKMPD